MITCGKCKEKHETVEQVKACYAGAYAPAGRVIVYGAAYPAQQRQLPHDGYYTVVFDGDDDRVTIRLRTQDKSSTFAPGKQIAAYLAGPDNEQDYVQFAFTNGDDGQVRPYLWKRFRNNRRLDLALATIIRDPATAGEAYALESGNCWRCGRKLTVPASIHRGLGPICAGKV